MLRLILRGQRLANDRARGSFYPTKPRFLVLPELALLPDTNGLLDGENRSGAKEEVVSSCRSWRVAA